MGYAPSTRTEVVLSDDADEANGSATPLPYDTVRLYAVPPPSLSELNDYRDWATALVFHEYTHILHMDDVGGFPAIVNAVFGRLIFPNGLVPTWMIEGLAVLHEGDGDGSTGRSGSALFDMYVRALSVEGDGLPGLAQASNPYLHWPRGSTPYALGGMFMAFLRQRYGAEALARYAADQGAQIWPYAPSWVGERYFGGRSFSQLWDDFRAELRARYDAQLAQVRTRPVTRFAWLTRRGADVENPRWSPDGSFVAYFGRSLDDRPGLFRVGTDGRDLGRTTDVYQNGTLALRSPREAIAAIGDVWHEFRVYDDLYAVELDGGGRRRLTDGERATDPDVTPDGGAVVYVARSGAGELELRRRPLGGGPAETIFARRGAQIFLPRVSPDGRRIAFELHEGERRDIAVLEGGELRRVTDDDAQDLAPSWTPDGRWLLFSSDRGGIYNLYAWDSQAAGQPGAIRQVTNVESGAFEPAVSPDGATIAFVAYSRSGYDLATIPFDPSAWLDPAPPPAPLPPLAYQPVAAPLPTRPYRAVETLGPTYWFPLLGADAAGTTFGAFTSGGDVIGHHAWAAEAWWSPKASTAGYSATYVGGWSWPSLDLGSNRFIDSSPGLPDRLESVWTLGAAGVTFTFTRLDRTLALRLGWSATRFDTLGAAPPPVPPGTPGEFRDGLLSGPALGVSYSDAQRFANSVSPEEGRNVSLRLSFASPETGSDYALARARASLAQYLRVPGTRHAVLALRLSGGLARGTLGGREPFSLGGTAQVDPLSLLLLSDVAPADQLRGYPSGLLAGNGMLLGNLEVRFPLFAPEWGHTTWPLFLRRVHGAVFLDVGDAFAIGSETLPFYAHDFEWQRLRFGAGAELRLEVALGYNIVTDVRIGLAQGLGQLLKPWSDGRPQHDPYAETVWYVLLGQSF